MFLQDAPETAEGLAGLERGAAIADLLEIGAGAEGLVPRPGRTMTRAAGSASSGRKASSSSRSRVALSALRTSGRLRVTGPRRPPRPPGASRHRSRPLVDEVEELLQDARGRAPDDVLHRDVVEVHRVRLAVPLPELRAEDRRVAQLVERHLDHPLDLPAVRLERHGSRHDADDGRDDELGRPRLRVVEQPQHLDRVGRQPDLLPRLTERRLDPRAVALFHDSAGKRELPFMMRHGRRSSW